MKIEFISNASFLFTFQNGKTLLTDPWYSGGAYYGSWYPYPPLSESARAKYVSSEPDFIYISHLHPDHLDRDTLRAFSRETPVLIGKLSHDHLRRELRTLGFEDVRELPLGEYARLDGGPEVAILGRFGGRGDGEVDQVGYELDTSMALRDVSGVTVFNAVDNPITEADVRRVVERFGKPDVAILPYGGASFYPHAGRHISEAEKRRSAEALKHRRLAAFVGLSSVFGARWSIPAAGSYVMGGRIAAFSDYLHQATPDEITAAWREAGHRPSGLCVMMTGDSLDAAAGVLTPVEDAPNRHFSHEDRTNYALSLRDLPLPQDEVRVPENFRIPWIRLLNKARASLWRAQERLNLFPCADVALHVAPTPGVAGEAFSYQFSLEHEVPTEFSGLTGEPSRLRVVFHIDASILLMVLLGAAIWNNVEGGALVEFERHPERYDPAVHSLMTFFAL